MTRPTTHAIQRRGEIDSLHTSLRSARDAATQLGDVIVDLHTLRAVAVLTDAGWKAIPESVASRPKLEDPR